jgi:hypothetical protein
MVEVRTGVYVNWEFYVLLDYPICVVDVVVLVLHSYSAEEYLEESPLN